MKNAAGELKLVDLFYAAGLEIYRVLLDDPAKIAEAFAADRREYICDIAAVARMSAPDEMAALRTAAEGIAEKLSPQQVIRDCQVLVAVPMRDRVR